MIKINLLPFRAARKKENIRRQISIFMLSVILLLLVIGYLWWNNRSALTALKNEHIIKTAEFKIHEKTIKQIDKIKKKVKVIKNKLDIIKRLEKNKTGPVLLLEELSIAVPRNRLWIDSLSEKKGILTLNGTAMDNDTVALFMTNLEDSEHVRSVDLKSTKLQYIKKHKLRVSQFVLTCKTYLFKAKPKIKAKGKHKKRKK